MYKGDLGRVFDVDSQANKCTVVLIPRLDYAGMAQRREEGRSLPFGRTNNNIRPAAKCGPFPFKFQRLTIHSVCRWLLWHIEAEVSSLRF